MNGPMLRVCYLTPVTLAGAVNSWLKKNILEE